MNNSKWVLRDSHSGMYWGFVSNTELGWTENIKKATIFSSAFEAKDYMRKTGFVASVFPAE